MRTISQIQNQLIAMAGAISDQNRDRNGDFKLRDARVVDDLVRAVLDLDDHHFRARWMVGVETAPPPLTAGMNRIWQIPDPCYVEPVFE